jgi:signal transduction histidine kinase/CheY-like chemotaxis protein/HPt (histidine-containing phosphotransfer) domain-containing protein
LAGEQATAVKQSLTERCLARFGHQYILLMMIVTRLGGSIGGALVIYYVELTLKLPPEIRYYFRVSCTVVVLQCITSTVLIALWELRRVRHVLKCIERGEPFDPVYAQQAGRDAVLFPVRHHRLEAWFTPLTCLLPVSIYMFWHGAPVAVLINLTWAVFMGINLALLATFFAVEHCMATVIRHLLAHGVSIEYRSVPRGKLRFRLGLCSFLIITTTALMIGQVARQRATDIINDPDQSHQVEAVSELRAHSLYITVAAAITGVLYATLMAGSVTKRVDVMVAAMDRVGSGLLSERLVPTGNDEIDILARQFNSMVERLDRDNRTIRDLNLNLEERVRERTRQLERLVAELSQTQKQLTEYNKQLHSARLEAEAANRAKSEFLANISHELRTPLNGVIGMTDLLMATPLNSQQRKYAQTTKFSGTSLLELLNEVLDFSKIEAGMLEVEKIPFDLHATIEPVIELMAHKCKEKSLEMAYFADPAVPLRLVGDPGRVRQIITNLVNNAIKFTERGKVVVRIGVVEQADRVATLRFTVQDTGIGIPESRFNRLFQAFSQVDASITRKYGGSGLGLVICKKLCELMGGAIGFDSEAGHGSTFWFALPFEVAESAAEADGGRLKPLVGLRALVVDQNETSRTIVVEQLANLGIEVCDVTSGAEALKRLKQAAAAEAHFTFALWDIGVSGLSKEEFAATVRSQPELGKPALVLLTPVGAPQDLLRLRKLGFVDCLSKPIMRTALLEALLAVVTNDGSEKARPRLGRKDTTEACVIPRTSRKGVRILLAEDNEINQQVALEILTQAGYGCEVVSDGRQAVEAVKKTTYHLVLMDCQMPEMSGLEATQHIREYERQCAEGQCGEGQPALPIVALTANALMGERDRCLAAGMNDYVCKPFDPFKLVETIESHLGGQVDSAGEPAQSDEPPQQVPLAQPCPELEFELVESPAAVIDRPSLLKRCLGKAELADKLLLKLHARLGSDLYEIKAAAGGGDCEQIGRCAHRLKGAAANLSAEALRAAAADLELAGRNGDIGAARDGLARLKYESRRFLQETLPLTQAGAPEPGASVLTESVPSGEVPCAS